jgi:hypothetical protein
VSVKASYAVVWREPGGARFVGKLELDELGLCLDGADTAGVHERLQLPYEELAGVKIGRSSRERMNGMPSLILELRSGAAVSVGSVGGTGIVFELGQALAELVGTRRAAAGPAVVVVPIRDGMRRRVLELIRKGPPFDLERSPLTRHAIYVTEREAIFVFEGAAVESFAAQIMRSPAAWRAAVAWERCLAGPPRIADEPYSWTRL